MAPEEDLIIYDLDRFATALGRQHGSLTRSVKRWRDAHSASADLQVAKEMLTLALLRHRDEPGSGDLIAMALLHSAVMAYARSLERQSNHRGKLALNEQFSDTQRAMHLKLVHLRDESIGHHGPAGFTIPWREDSVILLQDGMHWQPAVMSRMSLFEPEFAQRFFNHLVSIDPIVSKEVEKRRKKFQEVFDKHIDDDQVRLILEGCRLSDARRARIIEPLLESRREGRAISVAVDKPLIDLEPWLANR